MSTSAAAATVTATSDDMLPATKRQKNVREVPAFPRIEDGSKDGMVEVHNTEHKGGNDQKMYPNMALTLQKDSSWILSDVDSFGNLGPIPSINAVLEKRISSQFSISSLLPSSQIALPTENLTDYTEATTDNEGQGPAVIKLRSDGSSDTTKYRNLLKGDLMYPDDVKPMSFYEKQRLVQKITMLPSQYLRGLMDVISKYQPDTVRQIDDDGYAFDLGQMNENTVWAISDYVKESMIELDGYIKSLHPSENVNLSIEQARQEGPFMTATTAKDNITISTLAKHSSDSLTLLTPSKLSAITTNENQNKFLEQVELYSKPKVTKSRVKPSKKHECPTCNKQFRGRSELQNHIRTHTGEKPLKCSYAGCTKRYAHSSNLRAHERTHAGIKPYTCHYDGCGKSFAHSVSLKEHIWMHAGFQPYVCPFEGCQKKFTQVSNFARHKKTHEKEDHEHSIDSE